MIGRAPSQRDASPVVLAPLQRLGPKNQARSLPRPCRTVRTTSIRRRCRRCWRRDPIGDERTIEAHVNPHISHVSGGQAALVRLSALNQRSTPMVAATIIYVSADALTEQVRANTEPTLTRVEISTSFGCAWIR